MNISQCVKLILAKIPIIKDIYNCLAWYKGRQLCCKNLYNDILSYKNNNSKPVFLIFTPEHQNLGDHAIAYAETKMLNELNIPFFEVTNKQLEMLDYYKLMDAFNGALILVTGGGNLGSLWTWIENINREIIKNNQDSSVVILPNTIFYGESQEDSDYLKESLRIYNSHNNLYLYAREKTSYEYMKKIYKNVKLVPDMVLSLKYPNNAVRCGCVLCLRDDSEAILSEDEKDKIKSIADSLFADNVIYSDTVIDYPVSVKERENELYNKFNIFSSAQLVITDRLHGMIFAAITGTRCIVLDSASPKLRGCYEWIKNLEYIRFANDVSEIESIYESMRNEPCEYGNSELLHYFDTLKTDILSYYNNFYKK